MKKTLAFILIAIILLLSFSSCDFGASSATDKKNPKPTNKENTVQANLRPSKNNNKIKIGIACPLGETSDTEGQSVKNAIELAINEINSAGGLDGIKFEALVLDSNNYLTEKALYEDLYKEGMQVFLGSSELGSAITFSEMAEDDNLFVMTPIAVGNELDAFETTYQMSCSAFEQGSEAAKHFNENYVGKSIGIFYQSDASRSSEMYEGFKAELDPYFSVVSAAYTKDDFIYESQVQLLKNCDVLFMPVEHDDAWIFMSQMKNVYNEVDTYVGCDSFEYLSGIESFDVTSIEQEIIYLSYFDLGAVDGPASDFLTNYSSAYDEDLVPPRTLAASAYDCVYAVFDALKMAKFNGKEIRANMSPEDICIILEGVFDNGYFDFRGITGSCEGGERSHISWEERKAQKSPLKYIFKTRAD